MSEQLLVYLNLVEIGTLERDALGDMSFSYSNNANQRLSVALPLQSKKFGNHACESFFGGLLPENEKARHIIARKHNADPDNTFSLLKAIGRDCAGAVSLHEPTAPPTEPKALSEIGEELDERSLAEYLRNLPQSPLLLDSGARFSLAGYQDKAAVSIFEGRVYLPKDSPSTHILKPGIKDFEAEEERETHSKKATLTPVKLMNYYCYFNGIVIVLSNRSNMQFSSKSCSKPGKSVLLNVNLIDRVTLPLTNLAKGSQGQSIVEELSQSPAFSGARLTLSTAKFVLRHCQPVS